MSRTSINVSAASSANNTISKAKTNVTAAKDSFRSNANGVDSKIKNRNNINNRLNAIYNQLSDIEGKLSRISQTVQSGLQMYNSTDNQLKQRANEVQRNAVGVKRSSYYDFFAGNSGSGNKTAKIKGQNVSRDELLDELRKLLRNVNVYNNENKTNSFRVSDMQDLKELLNGIGEVSEDEKVELAAISENINDEDTRSWFAKFLNNEIKKEGYVIGGIKSGETEFLGVNTAGSVSGSILSYEMGIKNKASWKFDKNDDGTWASDTFGFITQAAISGAVAKGKVEGNFGYLHGEAEGKFLTGGVTGEAKALLIEDGKFRPSLHVGGNAEVSVLKGEAEAGFGTDQYGIFGKAEGDVLHAEAEAGVGVGYLGKDEKGNAIYGVEAEASAMASVAQGSVGGGITIFGIDIGVNAKGYAVAAGVECGGSISTKGVKGSFSGALGLGVGLDVSIDWSDAKWIGDTADAIGDFAGDAIDFAGTAVDYVGDFAKDTYDNVSEFVGNTAEGIYDFSSNVYYGAANAAEKVGDFLFGWI